MILSNLISIWSIVKNCLWRKVFFVSRHIFMRENLREKVMASKLSFFIQINIHPLRHLFPY